MATLSEQTKTPLAISNAIVRETGMRSSLI